MTASRIQAEAVASPGAPAQAGRVEEVLRVTVPVRRRVRLGDIWRSLPVGWMLGRRDVKIKYKQSALGPLWLVLQPLGMLLAVTIAFTKATTVKPAASPTSSSPWWGWPSGHTCR